jgi:hypothetical protein
VPDLGEQVVLVEAGMPGRGDERPDLLGDRQPWPVRVPGEHGAPAAAHVDQALGAQRRRPARRPGDARRHPETRVLIVSQYVERAYAAELLADGKLDLPPADDANRRVRAVLAYLNA